MSLKKALLAATMLSLPVAAVAQPATIQPAQLSGLYVGAGFGANWLQSTKVDGNPNGGRSADIGKVDPELGFVGVGSIGFGFGNGLRVEVEGNYRDNDVDNYRVFGGARNVTAQGGRIRSYGAMGNLLFDLPQVRVAGVAFGPYIGGGVGYVWHDYENVGARYQVAGSNAVFNTRINDEEGNFAYQGIVGAAFEAPFAIPGLALTIEYRFLGTLSPELNARTTVSTGGSSSGKVEVDNFNHSALIGLRYAFNAPRPVAVAPVAPAVDPAGVARTYLVFFDWDRADLTDRARQIIGEAARNARTVGSTRIEVAGHADRSGSPQYNQRLSQRRAEAVAAELARAGIARSEMVIQAFGESRPLVPTADGVREPQNRRVEIVLR